MNLSPSVVQQKCTDVAEKRIASKQNMQATCIPPKRRADSEPQKDRIRQSAMRSTGLPYRFPGENNVHNLNPMRSTCPANLTVFYLITQIFEEDYKLRPSSLCGFRHPSVYLLPDAELI